MDASAATVAIVTDGTADIPHDMAASLGIDVVPLYVTIGDKTYTEFDMPQAEFFRLMDASPKLPTTSQPPVGVFEGVYARALERASSVVAIHISEKLSGTLEAARQAAQGFGERVHVFDSKNLSWGLALQVVEAARAASAGASLEEVLRGADSARDRVRMLVGLDKLDNLARGGRIGAVSAFLGGMLNLKVTLTVASDGAFEPVARVRGTQGALQQTLGWVEKQMAGRTRAAFAVMHAMSADKADWLRQRLESTYTVTDMHVVEVGAVIAAHTGTGWGVAFLPSE